MKNTIVVLKEIYETIYNDSSLKENEKEWRYFFSYYINQLYIRNYNDTDINISYSAKYFKKLFSDTYKVIEDYFVEKEWLIIPKGVNNNKKYCIEAGKTATVYYNFPVCDIVCVNLNCKTITNKLRDLKSGELNSQYHLAKTKKVDIEKTIDYDNDLLKRYIELYNNKVTCTIPDFLLDTIKQEEIKLAELQLKIKQTKKFKKQLKEQKRVLQKYYNEKTKLTTIMKNVKNVFIDDFGYRLHTEYSRLHKDLRKYVKLNNNNVKEIDIVNCQPWLLSNLVDDDNFKKVCADGLFYEQFMETNSKGERDKVKKLTYKLCFGLYQKNRAVYYSDIKIKDSLLNKFISLYPAVWNYIEETNKENHSALAKQLQTLESDLILKNVWNKLMDNKINALTIHDSICIEEQNYNKALEILKEEIIKKGFNLPKFK